MWQTLVGKAVVTKCGRLLWGRPWLQKACCTENNDDDDGGDDDDDTDP
jgi:hypothetical protein